jgi:hypothetical protein
LRGDGWFWEVYVGGVVISLYFCHGLRLVCYCSFVDGGGAGGSL